jgi:hypothetical protein
MWSHSYVDVVVIIVRNFFCKINIFILEVNQIFQANRLDPVVM